MCFKDTNELNEYVISLLRERSGNLPEKHYIVEQEVVNHLMNNLVSEETNLQYVNFTPTVVEGEEVNQFVFRVLDDSSNENVVVYVRR